MQHSICQQKLFVTLTLILKTPNPIFKLVTQGRILIKLVGWLVGWLCREKEREFAAKRGGGRGKGLGFSVIRDFGSVLVLDKVGGVQNRE